MRVLVIRPEPQARGTVAKLAALGHEGVAFPLFEAVHDLGLCRQALATRYAALAISSAEAVRCLKGLGADLETQFDRTLFAVGRATGRLARETGFRKIVSAAGNGQDLAGQVATHLAVCPSDSPILYLAGMPRSGTFERALAFNNIPVEVAEIYRMRQLHYSSEEQQALLVNNSVDAAFFYSRENAKAFFALNLVRQGRVPLRRTLFFCLSHNIAEAVPEEFKSSVVASGSPDEDALLELLQARATRSENPCDTSIVR